MKIAAKRAAYTLVKMLILLFAVSVISFALVELSPIDTVSSYIGENAASQELRDSIAAKWGLNDPPVTRYFRWLGNILQGDMGTSITYRRPVFQIIMERFKMSLILMGLAWVLSGIVGFVLGVLAGTYEGSWLDKLIKVYCLIIQSSPVFWLAILLMVCVGASENSMGQWASAFTEAALGFTKTVGDLVGPCLFAATMGVSRGIYGKFGTRMNLSKFMIGSGVMCLCCYLLASLSFSPVLAGHPDYYFHFGVGVTLDYATNPTEE